MKVAIKKLRNPLMFVGFLLLGIILLFLSIEITQIFSEGHETISNMFRNFIALLGIWIMGFGYILTRNEPALTFEITQYQHWTLAMLGIWVILTSSTLAKVFPIDSETIPALIRLGFLVIGLIILGFAVKSTISENIQAYIARRLIFAAFVLFGVSVITFTLARLVPSDPAAAWLGGHPRAEQIEAMREALGLNKPIPIQYLIYMRNVFMGDWGKSISSHQPVLKDLSVFLPRSLEIVTLGIAIALLVGIPIGALSAARKDRPLDHVSRVISMSGVSMPSYFLGLLLQLTVFGFLTQFPIGGRMEISVQYGSPITKVTGFDLFDSLLTRNWTAFTDLLKHMILPAVTLAYGALAQITRMTRSTMLDVLGQDYIRTARASGLPERTIIFGYALKNAIVPTLTIIGLSYGYLLAGTFMVELVFNYPGMGYYAVRAIQSIDYTAIMGVTLLVAIFYVLINLGVDIFQAFLDPKVQLQ